ncbi:MAG: hypothetical protein ACK5JM_05900 [Rhodoblastus sp.]
MAEPDGTGRVKRKSSAEAAGYRCPIVADGRIYELADAESLGRTGRAHDGDDGRRERASGQGREAGELASVGVALGDADQPGLERRRLPERRRADECSVGSTGDPRWPDATDGGRQNADWIGCTDGVWRPVEPGSFSLAHGSAFRVGSGGPYENKSRPKILRGYGNAIDARLATIFIRALLDDDIAA